MDPESSTLDELYKEIVSQATMLTPDPTVAAPLPGPPPAVPQRSRLQDVMSEPATIAGITIGSVALVCLLALAAFTLWCRRQRLRLAQSSRAAVISRNSPDPIMTQNKIPGSCRIPVQQPDGEICIGIGLDPTGLDPTPTPERAVKGADLLSTGTIFSTCSPSTPGYSEEGPSLQNTGELESCELESQDWHSMSVYIEMH